ncbi:MAG: Crp/Fnr family transcriptional regulator [Myxococcota bacterium]
MTRAPSTLLRTSAFHRVDEQVVKRIIAEADEVRLERGGALWAEGSPATHIGWVRTGLVRELVRRGERELLFGFHGRGEIVGDTGALEALARPGVVHSATVEAHEQSVVLLLGVRRLAELAARDPELACGLAATSAERSRRMEDKLISAVYRSAPARMARVVLELGQRFGVRDSRGVIVNVRLTHRELAALAGASRETASNTLSDWRRSGLVLVEGKRIVLLDTDRLGSVAEDA